MSVNAGEKLRAAREAKGFSVDDIAARLKVPARYVNALESGDLSALPEATFVRGYVKAYARVVGIDAAELLESVAPVEVKAPKPLVAVDNVGTAPRRAGARTPNFRAGAHRHHWVLGAVLAVVAIGWIAWPGSDDAPVAPSAPVAVAPLPAPAAPAAPGADGMLTVPVPLPGNPATAVPDATAVPLPAPAAGAPAAAAPPVTTTATAPAPATSVPAAAPAPAAAAPAKAGLVMRFRGTCWVEVRDVDNVVLHTSVALANSELALEGKAPLTVTLGDSAVADVWYNGERVAVDRFARAGVARIIVGQPVR